MPKKAAVKTPTKRRTRTTPTHPRTSTELIEEPATPGDEAGAPATNGRSRVAEARAVNAYLTALTTARRRGRPVTRESLEAQMQRNTEQLDSASGADRLMILQRGIDLAARLQQLEAQDSYEDLETDFVACASSYAKRKHITYSAWRKFGVSPDVLRRAGINRAHE